MSVDKELEVFVDIDQDHGVPDLHSLCHLDQDRHDATNGAVVSAAGQAVTLLPPQEVSSSELDIANSALHHHHHQLQQHQMQLQQQQQIQMQMHLNLQQQQQMHLNLHQQQQHDQHQRRQQQQQYQTPRIQYGELHTAGNPATLFGSRIAGASVGLGAAAAAAEVSMYNGAGWITAGTAVDDQQQQQQQQQQRQWGTGPPPPKKRPAGTRTCQHTGAGGCSRRPSFNHPGRKAIFCSAHRQLNMVDVAHKARCQHPQGCTKHPGYGYPGEKPTHCAGHRLAGQIDRKRRKTNPAGPPSSQATASHSPSLLPPSLSPTSSSSLRSAGSGVAGAGSGAGAAVAAAAAAAKRGAAENNGTQLAFRRL